ncbi:MAG: TonB family protein [Kordiimonadaceae bacterium]|nr:TonB family protein [Kordiimonadaceae bacterium]MBO6569080.1 TonB family protein [Kordiimonadaceae bacterium]MBO6964555.1 TonB family protein [Kordiimonadaceae bacterium]
MKQLIAIAAAAAIASGTAFADEKSDKQAFREAYKAYQAAIAQGDKNQALAQGKLAFEHGEKIYGPDHKNTATLLLNYGSLVRDDNEAAKLLKDAVNRYEKLYGKDAEQLIDPLIELASKSAGFGSLGVARKHYSRALRLAEKHHPNDPFVEGQIRLEMGSVALHESRAREALRHLVRAKELFSGVDDPAIRHRLAQADFQIGKYKMAKKEYEEAETALLSSLDVYEEIAPNAQMTMTNHAFLIRVYEEQGMRDQATKHCRAIGAKSPTNPDQDYLPVYRSSPIYPASAHRAGKEGYAVIELTVDENGFVKDPAVIERKGHSAFETASLEAAQKFRYAPRYENGEAVATTGVRYRFTYSIRN